MHTIDELREKQALPLEVKIRLTEVRVRAWVNEYGEDGCYISFSGGKDSTVLMDIVRNRMGYNVPAMFVNVPTQFPELKQFAMTWDNVDIVNPKISFMQVCEKYGFPLISKETAQSVEGARIYQKSVKENLDVKPYAQYYRKVSGIGEYATKDVELNDVDLMALKEVKTKSDRSDYTQGKWKFFLDSDFEISHRCCNVMKKDPSHQYAKQTGRKPITAEMADESRLRTQKWLKNGCNGFNMKEPKSTPMSFWTEQDVLAYIYKYKLPICPVYGDVIIDYEAMGELKGQLVFDDFSQDIKYKTTGCNRTGCCLCAFGAHLDDKEEARFLMLKESHPKMYSLLDIIKNNGITYREAIEWTNEHLKDSQKIPL